jgi:hypothetical protein
MEKEEHAEYWDKKALDLVTEARQTNDFVSSRHELIEEAAKALDKASELRLTQSRWQDDSLTYEEVERRRWLFAHHAAWLETVKGYFPLAERFTTVEAIYYWRSRDLIPGGPTD